MSGKPQFELPKFRVRNKVKLSNGSVCIIEKIHQTPIGFMYDLEGKVGAYHQSELTSYVAS